LNRVFEEYKLKRQKTLDDLTEIRLPNLSATASQAAAKEVRAH
jgi:hypothetical protein